MCHCSTNQSTRKLYNFCVCVCVPKLPQVVTFTQFSWRKSVFIYFCLGNFVALLGSVGNSLDLDLGEKGGGRERERDERERERERHERGRERKKEREMGQE